MRLAIRVGLIAALVTTAVALASPVGATVTAQDKVPPNSFGCTLCHAGTGVTATEVPPAVAATLQPFGNDWVSLAADESGRSWADMVAQSMDSDGDLCSNGYELGDPDGNYFEDQQLEDRDQDPNRDDCTLPLDEQSWGNLKALFED